MFKMSVIFINKIGKLKIATIAKIETSIIFKIRIFLLINL